MVQSFGMGSVNEQINSKNQKLHPDAIVPEYASVGAGCFDLHSIENGIVRSDWGSLIIKLVLFFEVPDGYVMLIFTVEAGMP